MDQTKRPKTEAEQGSTEGPLRLRYVGFCGVDESFKDEDNFAWPDYIEWGILFREEKTGQMRFPKRDWVERFVKSKKRHLAAHLCSIRCEEVLKGDFAFVKELHEVLGFSRFQINATKGNGVNSDALGKEQVDNLVRLANEVPSAEFIVQRNQETKPLWEGLEETIGEHAPRNISFLFDASVGRGLVVEDFPKPKYKWARFGYAGGIKPENVETVIRGVAEHVPVDVATWIDMESGIRLKENDEFSAERAWKVCEAIEALRKSNVITFS